MTVGNFTTDFAGNNITESDAHTNISDVDTHVNISEIYPNATTIPDYPLDLDNATGSEITTTPSNATTTNPWAWLYEDHPCLREPYYMYSFDRFYVASIFILCIVSVVGLVFTFILMCSPRYSSRSFSFYFRCLIVSDTACIIAMGLVDLDFFIMEILNVDVTFKWYYFFEKLITFLLGVEDITKITSAWFLLAVTTDRFITIVFPEKKHKWCTRARAWRVCALIVVIAVIVEIVAMWAFKSAHAYDYYYDYDYKFWENWEYWDYGLDDDNAEDTCVFIMFNQLSAFIGGYYIFMNMFLCLAIPVPVVAVMTGMIIYKVRKMTREAAGNTSMDTRELKRVRQSSYGLAMVGVASVVTLTPVLVSETVEVVVMVRNPGFTVYQEELDVMWRVFHLVRMVNYSINFFILMLTGTMYRDDMKAVLCRKRDGDQDDVETGEESGIGDENEMAQPGHLVIETTIDDNDGGDGVNGHVTHVMKQESPRRPTVNGDVYNIDIEGNTDGIEIDMKPDELESLGVDIDAEIEKRQARRVSPDAVPENDMVNMIEAMEKPSSDNDQMSFLEMLQSEAPRIVAAKRHSSVSFNIDDQDIELPPPPPPPLDML